MRQADLIQQAEIARAGGRYRDAAALYIRAADRVRGPLARLYLDEAIVLHDRARGLEEHARLNAADPRRW